MKRLAFLIVWLCASMALADSYLGDFLEDETLHYMWHSSGTDGASITRATNGTISVYADNGLTQSVAGVTDTEDFDSLTGVHVVTIDLSADAFYAIGANYSIVLSAATIDGVTVNAVLAHFSIENRFTEVNVTAMASGVITATVIATDAITATEIAADAIGASELATDAIGAAELATDAVGAAEAGFLTDSTGFAGADVAAILADTDDIGVAGAGLTDLGGMSTGMLAEAEAEANDALVALDLDHLWNSGTAVPAVTAGAIFDLLLDDGTAVYDRTTDSQQATRDVAPHGSAMVGTDSAALASVATEARLAELDAANLPTDVAANASPAEVATELATYDGPTDTEMIARTLVAASYFDPAADAVANVTLVATTTTNTDMITAAAVNAEVDTALADVRLDELMAADSDIDGAAPPTDGSVFQELLTSTAVGFTWAQSTDSLEAIRNNQVATDGSGLTAIPWNASWDTEVESEVDDSIGGGTGTALTAIPWNASWDTEVQSEADDALVANHLDHIFATDYDPAAKPGVATALLNELVENNGGVSRYTAAALAQAPGGGDGSGFTAIPWNASWDVEVESEVDDSIGAGTGTSLTAIPWNASWDTEVESEVNDSLVVNRLDELMLADSDIDGAAPPTVGSVFHEALTSTAGSFTYDQTADSPEAIRDRGDTAWVTGGASPNTTGTCDSGSTTTCVDTERSESGSTYWPDQWIRFTDGTLQGQVRLISAFDDGTDTLTFAKALTTAVVTHAYEIVPAAEITGASAPTVVQIRTEMDTNSADLNTLITNLATAQTDLDLYDTDAERRVAQDAALVNYDAATGTEMATAQTDLDLYDTDSERRVAQDAALVAYDGPTDGEMIARTLATASYFDPAADAVANVTLVATTTTNTDMLTTAAVNAEVDTALADIRLDELVSADSDIDGAAPPTDGSIVHEFLSSSGTGFTYDQTTDSQQATRDVAPHGSAMVGTDSASTHSAADVRTEMDTNSVDLNTIIVDTNELQTDWVDAGRLDAILDARASQTAADAIETDTQDIQTRLPAALVSGRMDSDVAVIQASAANTIIQAAGGTADAGSTATTIVDTERAETVTDYWQHSLVVMTSGSSVGQPRRITGFNFSTDTLTVAPAFKAAIAAGETYIILRTAIADGLRPTTEGNETVDVLTTGEVGVDWDNVNGTLEAAELATDAANEIADALLDRTAGVETNRTVRQALRIMLSSLAGKLSGAATTTIVFRDTNDTRDRITATVTADGNRTAITLDGD